MNMSNKILLATLFVAFILGFIIIRPNAVPAAMTPSLGLAESYGVLAGTYTNTSASTTINGDVGFTTGPAKVPLGVHTNYGSGVPYPVAHTTDAANALTALNTGSCDFNFGSTTDLSLLPQPLVPGVYCIAAAASIGTGGITLNGAGTYIFRITGAFTTVNNSVVTLTGGASTCNVFWVPTAATTLGANTTFEGTVIDNANAITVGAHTMWVGRAWSLGAGTVTTGGNDTIDAVSVTVPTCSAPQLTVTKTVINNNGGTKTVSDFPLFIDGVGVSSGVVNTTTVGSHTVSETADSGYTTIISGDCAENGTISLALGEVKTCTITNDDIAPALHLRKVVVNDSGGTALNTAWTLTATGAGGSPTNLTGTTPVDSGATFKADAYALAESGGPSGYTASSWSCVKNGGAPVVGVSIVLGLGDTATCTITNDDIAPVVVPATLHIIKTVVNNSGGVTTASGFNLHVKLSGTDVAGSPATGVTSPGTSYSLLAGTYTVSEDAVAGYASTISGDCNSSGVVTLTAGADKTCTITNDDIFVPVVIPPASINVVKLVINDNGRTKTIADFPLFVNDTPVVSGETNIFSAPATYTVSETLDSNYTQTFSGDCPGGIVNLTSGDSKFCIITNDDIVASVIPPASINVVEVIINDNGGTKTATDFLLFVNGESVVSGATNTFFAPAAYTVTGTTDSDYTQTFSGDCDANGYLDIIPGDSKFCIATSNDIATPVVIPPAQEGTINVTKVVINDNGGNKTIADFPLFVNGESVVSGATNTFSAPAAYTVTETINSNYTQIFSGDCDANGHLDIISGDSKFCIVTNNDIAVPVIPSAYSGSYNTTTNILPVPPLIDMVKVPVPLVLPTGPGPVMYTYTLRNIGTVPVTNVTMVGDTCSPITLISGDTNSDAKLDMNETWLYTCTTTLLATHTNTVVATGWANGISATDIASATVVVGAPIVPPLIHITKIPNPLTLLAGGGAVTYTKTVTNPGTVALSNVLVTDDKCSPVSYISGDTNNDLKLDTTETWIYTCQTNLTSTTTNTAVATGEANGLTARDFAIATVVVAPTLFVTPYANEVVPILPNTGLPPKEGSFPWSVAVTSVILAGLVALYIIRKKQTV